MVGGRTASINMTIRIIHSRLLGEIFRKYQELDTEHRGERNSGRGANAAR